MKLNMLKQNIFKHNRISLVCDGFDHELKCEIEIEFWTFLNIQDFSERPRSSNSNWWFSAISSMQSSARSMPLNHQNPKQQKEPKNSRTLEVLWSWAFWGAFSWPRPSTLTPGPSNNRISHCIWSASHLSLIQRPAAVESWVSARLNSRNLSCSPWYQVKQCHVKNHFGPVQVWVRDSYCSIPLKDLTSPLHRKASIIW